MPSKNIRTRRTLIQATVHCHSCVYHAHSWNTEDHEDDRVGNMSPTDAMRGYRIHVKQFPDHNLTVTRLYQWYTERNCKK